ncbi:8-oxo-dGTP diphosphatase [Kineosphaera limosa]|uniref:NTP pyrophosphohydrolase MutT n=1 Tax=Kineosphaera limosa NBRC 100340 TaxID=1184609 RepID=K6WPX9_9MICO|nr:NUDIX hydrolase [Kineosphaera limosa]NYD99755.1 8-oxo-dGTP diphosphatase [Kineosphaera limosa]GAB95856.1 NTP pyrophosphohydrolase MutT [Kineosphaera limosa NBRC 100340]
MSKGERLIAAAGAVPWRIRSGKLQVALVHRPRYDDWSWPKGKLDPGEDWPVAAVREVWEETGLRVRLGIPLPEAHFRIGATNTRKHVLYWAAEITGGRGELCNEVDEVRWLTPKQARSQLSYARDREQLDALVKAHGNARLGVRPFAVVRHAKAVPRRKWKHEPDWLRPLDEQGFAEAEHMVDVLRAYGVTRLLSSSATRCLQTLQPYATAAALPLETSYALSEESYEKRPKHAIKAMRRHLHGPRPGAICSHGPLLPELLSTLAADAKGSARGTLRDAAESNLEKGEIVFGHLDRKNRIVAVERIPPHRP